MDVYLVRHGETDGNVAWRHQHPDTQLNERGKEQVAKAVAAILKLGPTHLLTSTNLRAVETARAIAMATDLTPATSHLFEELHRPTDLFGQRFTSLSTINYITKWFYGWKDGDGESYPELIQRITKARALLETLPHDARVVIVSHSVFINLFVEHRCREKPLSLPRAFVRFLRIMTHKNTGMTHLHYMKGKGVCPWEVVQANNGVHLKS